MEAQRRPVRDMSRGAPRHRDEWDVEFNRIVAFSDGVFAIAITLLVLALEVPESSDDVADSLLNQRGDLFAYALSFAVLGKLWISHHRFFSVLERFDGTLMALNLLYLAFVVMVPYTSEVLGDYGEDPSSVILYASVLFAVSLTFTGQIVYSFRAGLVTARTAELERRYAGPSSFLVAAVFLLSIPVALVSTDIATLMWLAIFIVGDRVSDWVGERIGREPPPPEA
jgi:uncharacterized membrane protein